MVYGNGNGISYRQRNSFLNFLKGCGCIDVVFMHVLFPGIIGTIVHKVSQYAVPIFLMISGYFAYSANGDAAEKIIRRTKRICKITIYAILLYTLYTLYYEIRGGYFNEWLSEFLNWKQCIKIIVFSNLDIISGGHLWFLPTQIIAYLIMLFIDKKNLYKIAYRSIPLLFAVRIIVSTIVWSNDMTWHLIGNFLVGAIPWMLLGNYLAHNKEFVTSLSNKSLSVMAFVGGLFAAVFAVLEVSVDLSEIGIVIYAFSLFTLAINNPTLSVNGYIEKIGDKYSLYIYILHIVVSGAVGRLARVIGQQESMWYLWTRPIIVAVVSIIVSIIMYSVVNFVMVNKSK